jgi:hypothetical protein
MKPNGKRANNTQNNGVSNDAVISIAPEQQTAEPTNVVDAKEEAREAIAEIPEPIGDQVKQIVRDLKPTAEDRIKNARNFAHLSERFEFLKGKSDDLKSFQVANAQTNTRLLLENQKGQKFEISNSNVIGKVLQKAAEELNILLLETENEILNFAI